jgi:predicted RNA-binding protein YlqC (UPF0109 family)
MNELALALYVKTIVEASVKVKVACLQYSTKTYLVHLHTDCEHAQTFFIRDSVR